MKKLELKHLALYLPYGLKIGHKSGAKSIHILHHGNGIGSISHILTSDLYKPILRPLSDIITKIEHNGEKFVPLDILAYLFGYGCLEFDLTDVLNQPYKQIEKLLEWHFDIFGLIEAGLAIDINTLEK
jgi:hypothetical protein